MLRVLRSCPSHCRRHRCRSRSAVVSNDLDASSSGSAAVCISRPLPVPFSIRARRRARSFPRVDRTLRREEREFPRIFQSIAKLATFARVPVVATPANALSCSRLLVTIERWHASKRLDVPATLSSTTADPESHALAFSLSLFVLDYSIAGVESAVMNEKFRTNERPRLDMHECVSRRAAAIDAIRSVNSTGACV